MNVRRRHVDAIGGHNVTEVPALRVKTVVVTLAEIDTDGYFQARSGDQGSGVSGPAGGGKSLIDPLFDLLLRVVGHVLRFALGQAAFAHELVGELEVGLSQVGHRRIQDQDVHRHQCCLLVAFVISAFLFRTCR